MSSKMEADLRSGELEGSRRGVWLAPLRAGVASALGLVASLVGCTVSSPFRGPGYDRRSGVTLDRVQGTVVVALTHAVLDGANRSAFDENTRRVVDSLARNEGFIGSSVRTRLFGDEVWTMTVWRDDESVEAFLSSAEHETAIDKGLSAVESAQFARFRWPTDSVPPSWSEALGRLARAPKRTYGATGKIEGVPVAPSAHGEGPATAR